MMNSMQAIAQDIMNEFFPHPGLKVGKSYIHPEDGVITITSGYYLDPIGGGLSNHWRWTKADGTPGYGYGGEWSPVPTTAQRRSW